MDVIKELIKIVLLTGYIKDEDAVSLLIVGKPESGKTSLTNRIVTNTGVLEASDISAYGITKEIMPLIEKNIQINHIIIPDFLVVIAKSKATMDRTLAYISSMTEEGITNVASYMNRGIEFKVSDKVKKYKFQCGVITSMTSQIFEKKKQKFDETGFLSRFVVVRYQYSSEYLNEVFNNIMAGNYLDNEEEKIILPTEKINIKYENEWIHKEVSKLARNKIASGNVDAYGIRLTKQIKTLLKAIALKNGKIEVTLDEWNEFDKFEPFINYSGNNITTIDS